MKNNTREIDYYWQKRSPAFSNQYASLFGIPLSPVGFFLQERLRKIRALISNLPGNTFLDVGCGSGIGLTVALDSGKNVIGIDYSQQMLEQAAINLKPYPKSHFKLVQGDATKLPIRSNSVDIVLASGLTDYLSDTDVKKFLFQATRVLKKNGLAIITFPRSDSPFSFLRSGIGLFLRQSILHLPPMETVYTQEMIQKLLVDASLEPLLWDRVLGTMYITMARKC